MFLNKLTQFFKKYKRIFYYIGLFFIVFGLFGDMAFAVDSFDETKTKIGGFVEGALKGISLLLALITYLSTIFLSPEWYNGSLFGMSKYFKEIWVMVSNLVYFIFAFILIWIAFMNIIGKNTDQYQLKQALPKFIVGVLIVPFSWFIVQFILSVASVLTIAALSLPFDTFNEFDGKFKEVTIPTYCTLNLSSITGTGTIDPKKDGDSNGFISCKEESEKYPGKNLSDLTGKGDSIDSIFGIIAMYTYGIVSLDKIDDVDQKTLNDVKTMGDLVVYLLFNFLFVFVYSILMIALGFVLMIRGIYIWIYIMISPLFGLMYFFEKKGGGDGFFGKFNILEFIKLAMVPVYTMLALSFGLLFLFVIGTGLGEMEESDNVKINKGVLEVGQFKLEIVGAVSTAENTTKFLTVVGKGVLGVVGSLILKIFGIVILWGTIMAALRSSEITKAIVDPLHGFGQSVGKIMTSAPGNIPIFKGQSMSSLGQAASSINSTVNQGASTRGGELAENLGFGSKRATDVNKHLKATSSDGKKEGIDYIIKNLGTANSAQIRDFNKILKTYGYKGKEELQQSDSDLNHSKLITTMLNDIEFTGKGSTTYKQGKIEDRIINGDSPIRKASTTYGSNGVTVNEVNGKEGVYNFNFNSQGSIQVDKNKGEFQGGDDYKVFNRILHSDGFDMKKEDFEERLKEYIGSTFGLNETESADIKIIDELFINIDKKYKDDGDKMKFDS